MSSNGFSELNININRKDYKIVCKMSDCSYDINYWCGGEPKPKTSYYHYAITLSRNENEKIRICFETEDNEFFKYTSFNTTEKKIYKKNGSPFQLSKYYEKSEIEDVLNFYDFFNHGINKDMVYFSTVIDEINSDYMYNRGQLKYNIVGNNVIDFHHLNDERGDFGYAVQNGTLLIVFNFKGKKVSIHLDKSNGALELISFSDIRKFPYVFGNNNDNKDKDNDDDWDNDNDELSYFDIISKIRKYLYLINRENS